MSNNILIEEDTQFDEQPSPEDIKKFMKENYDNVIEEENGIKPVEETDGSKTISFGEDATYNTNRHDGEYFDLSVNLQDDQHIITRKEKEDYLLACLNNELFTMKLDMLRGFSITCRDLSVYENKVVQRVLFNYAKKHPDTLMSVMMQLLRQVRLPMQIMAVGNTPYENVSYSYNAASPSEKQLDRDAKDLYSRSMEMEMNTPQARYQLYMKALNVFENKLKRLEEASFNANFWKPADQDSL